MPRSKSPATARKSANDGNDAHIQAGISLAVLLLAIVASQNYDASAANPQKSKWIEFFQGKGTPIHAKYWNYTVLTTLHALNTAQSASGGFWLNSAIGNYFATFGATIVAGLFFSAGNINAAINKENVALAGACWFIVNNAIGGVNVWDEIKKATNGALDQVLTLSTLAFTLNAAFEGVKDMDFKVDAWTSLSGVILTATSAAIIANGANFFPLNKGISFDGFDDAANRAFTTVCFVALITSFGFGETFKPFATFFGGADAAWNSAGALVLANALHSFITGAGVCPAIPDPVGMLQDKLYEITGLSRE